MKSLLLALLILPTMALAENAAPPVAPKESVASKLESTVISFLDATQNAGNKLSDAAGKVINLASSEIPIVIKEYLNWHFTTSLIWFCVPIIVLVSVLFLCYKYVVKTWGQPWFEEGRNPDLNFTGILSVVIIAATIISVGICPVVACNNLDWIKISIAPRVYLIDQFQHLAK